MNRSIAVLATSLLLPSPALAVSTPVENLKAPTTRNLYPLAIVNVCPRPFILLLRTSVDGKAVFSGWMRLEANATLYPRQNGLRMLHDTTAELFIYGYDAFIPSDKLEGNRRVTYSKKRYYMAQVNVGWGRSQVPEPPGTLIFSQLGCPDDDPADATPDHLAQTR